MSVEDEFPIGPSATIKFEKIEFKGWEFHYSKGPMFNTTEIDQVSDVIKTQTLPDVIFGSNRLYLVKKSRNFLYEFSPVDSLQLSAYEERTKALFKEGEDNDINYIDMIPENVQVPQAEIWKKKDMSKIDDYSDLVIISDWTYSTPYKGTLLKLSDHIERIKESVGLDLTHEVDPDEEAKLSFERSDELSDLPVHRLTPDNPIKHYVEVPLFEDELEDSGQMSSNVRFRVMDDCFYVLLRYYVRVDEAIVRVLDTRIFHDFETNEISREFWHKECTYEQLRDKNFKISSEWSLNPSQSDLVFASLDQKMRIKDVIRI